MHWFAVKMLSTDAKEHLCMCEYLKSNEMLKALVIATASVVDEADGGRGVEKMPISYPDGMTKTHSISTFTVQLTV